MIRIFARLALAGACAASLEAYASPRMDASFADAVARFESSGLTDRRALFDAYRLGGSEPALRDVLARWYAKCSSRAIQLDVDTLLDQLEEPHECLPRWPHEGPWFALPFAEEPAAFATSVSVDQVERGDVESAQRALVALVVGRTNAHAAARAAVRRGFDAYMTARHDFENGGPAVPAFRWQLREPSGSSLDWLGNQLPSVLAEAIEAEIAARSGDAAFVDYARGVLGLPFLIADTKPEVLPSSTERSRDPFEFACDDPSNLRIREIAVAWTATATTEADRVDLTRRFETVALAIDGHAGNPGHPLCIWPAVAAELGLRSKALIDRALDLAIDIDSTTFAQVSMCEYLSTCDLDADQQWRLCSLETLFGDFAPEILGAFSKQGAGALPRVPQLRKLLTEAPAAIGNASTPVLLRQKTVQFAAFEALLAIAKPSRDDRAVLASAIRFGPFEVRKRAAGLVARFRVDDPEIRAALHEALADQEPLVRCAAEAAEAALDA